MLNLFSYSEIVTCNVFCEMCIKIQKEKTRISNTDVVAHEGFYSLICLNGKPFFKIEFIFL